MGKNWKKRSKKVFNVWKCFIRKKFLLFRLWNLLYLLYFKTLAREFNGCVTLYDTWFDAFTKGYRNMSLNFDVRRDVRRDFLNGHSLMFDVVHFWFKSDNNKGQRLTSVNI
jgi:hypothetical protein